MSRHTDIGVSLKIIKFSMKLIGLWKADNTIDKVLTILIYTCLLTLMIIGVMLSVIDFFYILDDIYSAVNMFCAMIAILNLIGKLTIFGINRQKVFDLIDRIENTIENGKKEEEYGINAIIDCERQCVVLVIALAILTQGATANYVILPFVENFNGNTSEKSLPVPIHVGKLSHSESPYYEIGFVLEAAIGVSAAITSITLNIFLMTTNLHLVCQFKILHNKLKWTFSNDLDIMNSNISRYAFENLRKCIKIHMMLIDYTAQIENACSYMILVQMLSSGLLMCTSGFQIFFFSGTILKFVFGTSLFLTSIGEFFLVSWSCNEIILASAKVGDGAYNTTWYDLSATDYGKAYRDGLQLLMMRSHRPCYLTAGKFCIVSLESFNAVITTATSYFALLRKFVDDAELRN